MVSSVMVVVVPLPPHMSPPRKSYFLQVPTGRRTHTHQVLVSSNSIIEVELGIFSDISDAGYTTRTTYVGQSTSSQAAQTTVAPGIASDNFHVALDALAILVAAFGVLLL